MNYIITFLISMLPLVELRGAVPYAIATGIPMWQALIIGVVGNMLPIPIIFFFARRVLEWGADKPVIGGFFTWCLKKGHSGGKKLAATAGNRGLFIALLLLLVSPFLEQSLVRNISRINPRLELQTKRRCSYARGYPRRTNHGNTNNSRLRSI